MAERIVIIGAGGFGKETYHLIDRNRYNPVGFIDPDPSSTSDLPLPVLGDDCLISELKDRGIASCVCVAIGDMKRRNFIFELALQNDLKLPPIVHSTAVVLTEFQIGIGTIIYPNVVIMNNCKIGKGVLLNSGVTVGHDVEIGDFSNINPGAHLAGRIKVGQGVIIGLGSSILENVQIGDKAIIGAGSVVLRNVAAGTVVYGVPAKPENMHSD